MPARRFPPPWSAEVQPNHYVVRDANKQQLAYVYYESEPGRRSASKLLTKDEAPSDRLVVPTFDPSQSCLKPRNIVFRFCNLLGPFVGLSRQPRI